MAIQSFDVAVGTTTLHVHEHTGSGDAPRPALVFLHYFGGSGRTWEPVMTILASHGWRCLAPDLRGFGDSPPPGENWTHYTVDTMADDIHGLTGRLALERFIIVGHSLGAKVALAMAAHRPAGLAGVALLAPSPPTPEPMEDSERARLLGGHGNPEAARETLQKITAHSLPPPFLDVALADNLRSSAPAWRSWLEHGSREDISSRMPQIGVGVRVAVGEKDKTITASLVEREVLARLTHAPTSPGSLSAAGHLLPLEVPEAAADFLFESFASF